MVDTYTNPLSITSQFSFCGLPFRLDTYSGCAFNCTYCFARLRGGNVSDKKLRPADPDQIITRFKNALRPKDVPRAGDNSAGESAGLNSSDNSAGLISEFIRRRMPLHFGGMSDPFQPAESQLQVSLKVLRYLCAIQYPVIISTRSTLPASEPYLSVLKSNPNLLIQFSFSTSDDKLAQISEPFANPPSQLLKSIEHLAVHQIKTAIRWQPYIPLFSEEPSVFIPRVAQTGVRHLAFEHLKLPLEKSSPLWTRLSVKLDYDIREHYREMGGSMEGREYLLPISYKLTAILKVKEVLRKYAITFGAADNEVQYLSDTSCCCSGADQFPEFRDWNKFQIAHAIRKSAFGPISFSLIAREWAPTGSIDMFINSKSRIPKTTGHNKVGDYIKKRWEDLDSPFNPTKFYGVTHRNRRDANGMRIFEWDETITCHYT